MTHAPRPARRLRLPLLDRLCDDAPPGAHAPEALRRDLEALFNTTRSAPAALEGSVPGFGLPPIAGRPASALPADDLARALMDAVLRFEPRIAPDSLCVVPDDASPGDTSSRGARRGAPRGPVHRFCLRGRLRTDGCGAPVHLLTEIDLDTGHARLTEGA